MITPHPSQFRREWEIAFKGAIEIYTNKGKKMTKITYKWGFFSDV